MTNTLVEKRCIPCEGGMPALDEKQISELHKEIAEWQVDSATDVISRDFCFKNFYHTMAFVNAVAWIANQENHHPDLEVGYNHCRVSYTTHAIKGLSQNDFICAAKVDCLLRLE